MIGQTISHHKIKCRIGDAGTGIVYRLKDTTLSRLFTIIFPEGETYDNRGHRPRCTNNHNINLP